jgi:hypothetical protein
VYAKLRAQALRNLRSKAGHWTSLIISFLICEVGLNGDRSLPGTLSAQAESYEVLARRGHLVNGTKPPAWGCTWGGCLSPDPTSQDQACITRG